MTVSESAVQIPRLPRPRFRLERAEFLKLRKSRSVWIPLALLTVGAISVMYTVVEIFHLYNSTKYGPAGGLDNFRIAVTILGQLGGMIAVGLVGAAAGTQDLSSGVFRDLVSTGRSRLRLFLARIPGGLGLVLPFVASAYAIAAVLCVALAGSNPTPSAWLFTKGGLWVLFSTSLVYVVALGLGSLLGSRAATISVLIAYLLPVQGILHAIGALGRSRDALLSVAMEGLSPLPPPNARDLILVSHTTSLIVLALWMGIAISLGVWRTQTRDT